jgi:hypothetical protein
MTYRWHVSGSMSTGFEVVVGTTIIASKRGRGLKELGDVVVGIDGLLG